MHMYDDESVGSRLQPAVLYRIRAYFLPSLLTSLVPYLLPLFLPLPLFSDKKINHLVHEKGRPDFILSCIDKMHSGAGQKP